MQVNDPAVQRFLRQSMVVRIATLSLHGRPSVNPIYFTYVNGRVWIGTLDWTLAARNVKADPRVSALFALEAGRHEQRMLRVSGRAEVIIDAKVQARYNRRVAFKYVLNPGGMWNALTHLKQAWLKRVYNAQGLSKGKECVIEIVPESVEWVDAL